MRVTALKDFKDKYTGEVYRKGAVLAVNENRAKEMNAGKHGALVEIVEDKPPEEAPEGTAAGELPEDAPKKTAGKKTAKQGD